MKKYDLIIVGAGPGGAMAAKTAGENGLKTAVLERKTNPAEITRACAMMFAVESDYYFAEAEITGSMMCGRKAANAVTVALMDDKPNRDGVIDYIHWWRKSFPEFDDYRNFFMIIFFHSIFSEKEFTYLYSLLKKPLRPTLNPMLVVRIVKDALEPLMPQVRNEMPTLAEKIDLLEVDNIDKLFNEMKSKLSKRKE